MSPAFNVYTDEVVEWGIETLHRAAEGVAAKTAVHICYGYGIQANNDWKKTLGGGVAAVRGDLPRHRGEQDRPGLARVPELPGPAGSDGPARRQGRHVWV